MSVFGDGKNIQFLVQSFTPALSTSTYISSTSACTSTPCTSSAPQVSAVPGDLSCQQREMEEHRPGLPTSGAPGLSGDWTTPPPLSPHHPTCPHLPPHNPTCGWLAGWLAGWIPEKIIPLRRPIRFGWGWPTGPSVAIPTIKAREYY